MEKAIPNPKLFIFRKLLLWTFRLEEAFVSRNTDEDLFFFVSVDESDLQPNKVVLSLIGSY